MKAWKWWQNKCYSIHHSSQDDSENSQPLDSTQSAVVETATSDKPKAGKRTSSKFYVDIETLDGYSITESLESDKQNADCQQCASSENVPQLSFIDDPAATFVSTVSCESVSTAGDAHDQEMRRFVDCGNSYQKPRPASPCSLPSPLSSGATGNWRPWITAENKSPILRNVVANHGCPRTTGHASPVARQPVPLIMCSRNTLYPPSSPSSCPSSPLTHSNLSPPGRISPAPPPRIKRAANKPAAIRAKPNGIQAPAADSAAAMTTTVPGSLAVPGGLAVVTRNRNSVRRSFTTEDVDIGISQKPKAPSRIPSLPSKPPPSVLRRVRKPDFGCPQEDQTRQQHLQDHKLRRRSKSLDTVLEQRKPPPPPKPQLLAQKCTFSGDLSNTNQPPIISPKPHFQRGPAGKLKSADELFSKMATAAEYRITVADRIRKFDSNAVSSKGGSRGGSLSDDADVNSGPCSSADECFESFDGESDHDTVEVTPGHLPGTVYSDLPRCESLDEPESGPVDKARKVANELLMTEKSYVDKLNLIDQVFHNELMQQNHVERFIPGGVIPHMFSNIKSIYQFHHDFLLPQLEQCMENWESGQRIGIVLRKFAPFLKLYTDYIKNFDNATSVINMWTSKSTRFAAFLDEIQRRPECGNLTLLHHLLGPIQRVPRYEMLLKEYLRHLDEDSSDRIEAEAALSLVTLSARHANGEITKIEKFRRLLEINESLGGALDLVSPNRELIKEGRVTKISARDGSHLDRYLFLFNDSLLLCTYMPLLPGIRQQYKVKAKLDVAGMKVLDGDNREDKNTFHIKSKQKSIELLLSTNDAKVEWQKVLWRVITTYTKNEQQHCCTMAFSRFTNNQLGERAPTWVKDQETYMCMLCTRPFKTFRRRHHCRACGKVICGDCSTHKAALSYDNDRENRVCDECYSTLRSAGKVMELVEATAEPALQAPLCSPTVVNQLLADRTKARSILKVKATDASLISGYLHRSTDRKSWKKSWIAVHKNFAMYFFKAHQDVIAHKSQPLPGFKVQAVTDAANDAEFIFKIYHSTSKMVTYFMVDDSALMNRWISTLEYVVQAELPPLQATNNLNAPIADNTTSAPFESSTPSDSPADDSFINSTCKVTPALIKQQSSTSVGTAGDSSPIHFYGDVNSFPS